VVARREALAGVLVQPGAPDPAEEVRRREALPDEYVAPPAVLVRLTDAWFDTTLCLGITSRGEYVYDSLRSHRQAEAVDYRMGRFGTLKLPPLSVTRLDAPALVVGLPAGRSYYHWVVEALSRELLVRGIVPPDITVLAPALGRMERETMRVAGIDERRIAEFEPGELVQVPELYVPSRGVRTPGRLIPRSMHALHSLSDGRAAGQSGERIFISRSGARKRRIANEPEVAETLAKRGFTVLALEKLSVAEQIDRFAAAEIVIGTHGAGLTNLVFANPGTRVVELQPPKLDEGRIALYWNLAAIMGLRYSQVICAEAPGQEESHPSGRHVVVDAAHLESHLQESG
jgi:capsular polysaccharide biosynthesis protein